MGWFKAGLYFITIILVVFLVYLVYINFFLVQIQQLDLTNYRPGVYGPIVNVSSEVKQFYPNMRFSNSTISYYIHEGCEEEKTEKMKEAFSILSEKTQNLVFIEKPELEAQILVSCNPGIYEKEKNMFIAGEGGPTQIVNSSIPVILRGKILLYNETRAKCEKPILELHELLHVLGYEHINESKYVMYPYLNCEQELNPSLIEHLSSGYSQPSFVEVYFEDIKGYKERYYGRWYLNLNVSIANKGIIDSVNTKLEVYENENLVQSFDLETIKFGGGKKFFIQNLAINNKGKIELKLKNDHYEIGVDNNQALLNI